MNAAALSVYGNVITIFFSSIFNNTRGKDGENLDDCGKIPLVQIMRQRNVTPFPEVSDSPESRDPRIYEANRLIDVLNKTEDVRVFRIAINALLLVIQGKTGYRPIFDGKEYPPGDLTAALEEVEESDLLTQ